MAACRGFGTLEALQPVHVAHVQRPDVDPWRSETILPRQSTDCLKSDVWFSAVGRDWQQATANTGWALRAYHQAVVLNDCVYLFDGGIYVPEY